ncbi:queuosine precursor transporter [Rhodococcus coprophilus]|uniref:Probable queuosine precursor transporter n=1 Tax=Rhodococcus coprophilus TaxID=38310 RepID=A0A2X4UJA2_9NOCA|nr:queuosine precursor transporter [Rhodococcus coprophilus]MBM7458593.1 putative integral membrane protein (TIGR00697 family) [Rhodococcus coprophilus]SQI33000.1 Inner membrane protein yhhQ [Rhodococcus coprophilus]
MTQHETNSPSSTSHHAAFARVGRSSYPGIVVLFTAVLMISNICATKGIAFFSDTDVSLGPLQILPIITDGGFFLFPLAYILGDVLSEVYGFAATRRAVFYGFGAVALSALAFWVAQSLPAAEFYPNQESFEAVLGVVPRMLLAGLAGYLVGQLLNSYVLVRIKERTQEKHLWARLIGSTVVGEFADTLVFCSIAAGAIGISTWDDFANFVVVGFLWKTLLEVVLLPVTYRVIAYVKKREPTYAPVSAAA